MRKLQGYKLLYGHDLERFFKAFTASEPRFRRMLLEEFWNEKLKHEEKFHARSAWLEEEDGSEHD